MKMPLVSIAVVTYNSSKTVIETLDSIRDQTYLNIELIISDDCSKDDTVEVCRKWVEQNKDRFVRADVFNVEKNTGVSANFNRADAASRGEWGKPIAGDDLLLPNAIQEYVNYIIPNNASLLRRLNTIHRLTKIVQKYQPNWKILLSLQYTVSSSLFV